jgi:hypothetical protein
MTSNNEIANQIIDLYFNEHKSIRDVCRILGKSSHDVVPVIKEHRLQLAPDTHDSKQPEKDLPEVSAYKLFAEGKSPVQVTTKLNLPAARVELYYTQYWKLVNMHQLYAVYNELRHNIGYFLEVFRLAKKEHLTPEEIISLVNVANEIPDLERKYKQLNVSIVEIGSKLYANEEELKKLDDKISEATKLIKSKSELIERKSEILLGLISQRQKLEQYMDYIKSNQDYKEIEQIVAKKVAELLSDKKKLLELALVSVVTALRSNYDRRFIFNTLQSSFFSYPSIIDDKSSWESRRPAGGEEQFVKERVLEDANRMLECLKRGIVDTTIAAAAGLEMGSQNQQALPYYESS